MPSASDDTTLILSVVRLDRSIEDIGLPVEEAAKRVLDDASCGTPADAAKSWQSAPSTEAKPCTEELRAKVDKSILRYRRDQDRWTSLTSLLLKSLAFYRSLDPAHGIPPPAEEASPVSVDRVDNEDRKLPIVDLPRTKHNRPYLPKQSGGGYRSPFSKEEQSENCHSAMNVTHQYPWVCMAQQQLSSATETKSVIKLGVDVVVFTARLSEYCPTIDDFLKNFKSSCTPWEWERINSYKRPPYLPQPRSYESKLREFYLRWSMKEAYTKAMGLGMHINFDEFETSLYGVDLDSDYSDDDLEEGIWASIMRHKKGGNNSDNAADRLQYSTIGKMKKTNGPWEYWEFIFVPLHNDDEPGSSTETEIPTDGSGHDACVCICRGPLTQEEALSDAKRTPATIEPLTLVDLVRLHGGSLSG